MSRSIQKDIFAILVAILFLFLGLLAILIAQRFLNLQGDLIIVFLILVPIIAYTIFSGKVGELRAAGLEAKFVTVARQSVEFVYETIKFRRRNADCREAGRKRADESAG